MTDVEWNVIRGYLPGQEEKSGRTAKGNESFMNEVFWIIRNERREEIYLRVIGNGIRYTKDLFDGKKMEHWSIDLKF